MHTGWMSYRKESVNNYDTVMLGMQRVAYGREAACGVGRDGCYVWDGIATSFRWSIVLVQGVWGM